jgi:hypothetical protein
MGNCGKYGLLCLFFTQTVLLFSLGKADLSKRTIYNTDWTLCITQFDVSALPQSRAALGGVVTRILLEKFEGMEYKLRKDGEYDYYWKAAWLRTQTEAAKKLAEKQAERDKLLFLGERGWKEKQQRKKLDKEIAQLRANLKEIEINSPNVSEQPHFAVSKDNNTGTFPPVPLKGTEYALCSAQKADGLLLGRISDYYGRILVELQLWTVWTNSISYEDRALFSIEDIDLALGEFSARLINAISGMVPATIIVNAKPDNAVIIVDEHHAGRGKSEEIDRTPGPVEVTVYAENHVTTTEKITLYEGERTEAEFELKPVPVDSVTVDTTDKDAAKIYSGGLYVGTSPVAISGQLDSYKQISAETTEGKTAQTLFQIQTPEKSVMLHPKTPALQGRTEKARKGLYGALGRFWIIGPLAFFSIGLSNSYADAFNIAPMQNRTPERRESATMWYNISMGFVIAAGVSFAEVLIRVFIYLYQGNKEGSIITPSKEEAKPITATETDKQNTKKEEGTGEKVDG